MLQLMFFRLLAPRAFQVINAIGLTAIFLGFLATASGMIDHSRIPVHQSTERVKETR
jgi:hypothetical protein